MVALTEEAHHGRDAATLEVVIEAAGPLTFRQLEGLGLPTIQVVVPPLESGLSKLSMSVVAQLSIVVAT